MFRKPIYRAETYYINYVDNGNEMLVVCQADQFQGGQPPELFKQEAENTFVARFHKDHIASRGFAFREAISGLKNAAAISEAIDAFEEKHAEDCQRKFTC